jgi:hypothetical protein
LSPQERTEQSHLFLVRLWLEEQSASEGVARGSDSVFDGQHAGRLHGRVQHVLRGEAHTFRDWQALVELLTDMSHDDTPERPKEK